VNSEQLTVNSVGFVLLWIIVIYNSI